MFAAYQKSGFTTFLTSCKHFNCVKMLLISRKGNPDGSLSNYPSLRILWPEGLFRQPEGRPFQLLSTLPLRRRQLVLPGKLFQAAAEALILLLGGPQGLMQVQVVIQRQVPQDTTCDMAAWLITAETDLPEDTALSLLLKS